jgi:hypothetical protein
MTRKLQGIFIRLERLFFWYIAVFDDTGQVSRLLCNALHFRKVSRPQVLECALSNWSKTRVHKPFRFRVFRRKAVAII